MSQQDWSSVFAEKVVDALKPKHIVRDKCIILLIKRKWMKEN